MSAKRKRFAVRLRGRGFAPYRRFVVRPRTARQRRLCARFGHRPPVVGSSVMSFDRDGFTVTVSATCPRCWAVVAQPWVEMPMLVYYGEPGE